MGDEKLKEAMKLYSRYMVIKDQEKIDLKSITFSKKFERNMNRIFRERMGIKKIPHPQVDTLYERVRSKIVRFFIILSRIFKRR